MLLTVTQIAGVLDWNLFVIR